MAERFRPHHDEEDDENQTAYAPEQSQSVAPGRFRGFVERFIAREEADEGEDDEDEEKETDKKRRKKLSQRFLQMLGVKQVSDTRESPGRPDAGTSEEVNSWFEAVLNQDKEPESDEAKLVGDTVELPPPAADTRIEELVETGVEDGESGPQVISNDIEVDIHHENTTESPEIDGEVVVQSEESLRMDMVEDDSSETMPAEGVVQDIQEGVHDDRDRESEASQSPSEVIKGETVEIHRESTGAALAAFVAAERISAHRKKNLERDLREDMDERQKETEKRIDSLLEKQQELKRQLSVEQEERTRAEKEKKAAVKPGRKVAEPAREQSVSKRSGREEKWQQVPYREVASKEQVSLENNQKEKQEPDKKSGSSREVRRAPERSYETRDKNPKVEYEQVSKPEKQEVKTPEQEKPRSFEVFDDTRHEIMDQPNSQEEKKAELASSAGGTGASDGVSIHNSQQLTESQSAGKKVREEMKAYSSAIASGVIAALVVVAAVTVIMMLR